MTEKILLHCLGVKRCGELVGKRSMLAALFSKISTGGNGKNGAVRGKGGVEGGERGGWRGGVFMCVGNSWNGE